VFNGSGGFVMKKVSMRSAAKLFFLIVLALSLTMASGCGGGSGTSADTQKSQTEEAKNSGQESGEADVSDGLASFQTKDIYSNDVNQDIFQDYKLTLVNVWGTFCGPCLEELPYLGELQKEYESKGVNIVGIVCDVQDENLEFIDEQISLAKQIVDSTGADYLHMVVSIDMIDPVMSKFDAIPASFFVDSNGSIISEFYIGARSKDEWKALIDENLSKIE
jgi:thiol-disulfide isomerase/thioredoxin